MCVCFEFYFLVCEYQATNMAKVKVKVKVHLFVFVLSFIWCVNIRQQTWRK